MTDGINKNLSKDDLTNIVSSDNFLKLDKDTKNKIIDTFNTNKDKDGGIVGKFIGSRTKNAAINIAFIIAILFFFLIAIDTCCYLILNKINYELIKTFVPVITLALGYIFGKGK